MKNKMCFLLLLFVFLVAGMFAWISIRNINVKGSSGASFT